MKLGYTTWGMPMVPIDDALAHLAHLGYDGVEIAVIKSSSRNFTTELGTLDAAERRRIRAMLAQYHLELPALAGHTSLVARDPEAHAANMARLRATVDLAVDLAGDGEPPVLDTTVGGTKEEAGWDDLKALLVERVGELAVYGARRGVVIALEPHVATVLDHPDKVLWLLDQVRSEALKLTFDISHFEVVPGIPMEESIRLLAPHAVFAHVKDQRGLYPDHEFLVPGEGSYDFARFLTLMAETGYTGHVMPEVSFHVQDRPGYDPYSAAELAYRTLARAFADAGIARR